MTLQAPLAARRQTLLVKLEDVPGNAETTGLLALLAFEVTAGPSADWTERKGTGAYSGHNVVGALGARTGQITFTAELRCGTGATLDPAVAACLQACGALKDAESYAQDVQNNRDAGSRTITIWREVDGVRKRLVGAAGNVTIKSTIGERVLLDFEFSGRWEAPTDEAMDTTAPVTSLPMRTEAGTFTLGGETIKIAEFELNWGATPALRADAAAGGGVGCYDVLDFDPEISIDPEFDRVAGYDFYGKWMAGDTAAIVLSATAGDRTATITLPRVNIKELAEGDRDGIATLDYTGACLNDGATAAVTLAIT